ncbi:ABC transporter permease [Salmonella enterica subsp. arizonae]|uniref:ABC transporter permease n=1 Tax=Salmonella enterica subsp. arizonae TaxID=59203 RepID=A0A379TS39_SALER|nr:ABC transporter permease [Salmonella enterica subsp. arizonae]
MSEAMMWLLIRGVWETLAMTFVSGFFGFVIGLAGRRIAICHASGANYGERQAVSRAFCGGQYFPLDSIYHPAGVDDSFYPGNCRHLHWFTGRDCAADRRRRAFYRPYGWKMRC